MSDTPIRTQRLVEFLANCLNELAAADDELQEVLQGAPIVSTAFAGQIDKQLITQTSYPTLELWIDTSANGRDMTMQGQYHWSFPATMDFQQAKILDWLHQNMFCCIEEIEGGFDCVKVNTEVTTRSVYMTKLSGQQVLVFPYLNYSFGATYL